MAISETLVRDEGDEAAENGRLAIERSPQMKCGNAAGRRFLKFIGALLLLQPIGFALAQDLPGKEVRPGSGPGETVASGFSRITRIAFSKNAKYGMRLVPDPLGGEGQALRIELRFGDCGKSGGWNDCDHNSERVELISADQYREGKLIHLGWKVYFPEDFKSSGAWIVLGQLHQNWPPNAAVNAHGHDPLFQFYHQGNGLKIRRFIKSASGFYADDHDIIIPESKLRGRWHSIDVTALISKSDEGYFSVSADGEEVYGYKGPTLVTKSAYFKLGIYRLNTSSNEPPAVVYYRDIFSK